MHFSLRYPYRVPFSDALCRPHGPAGGAVSTAVVLVDVVFVHVAQWSASAVLH